MKIMRQKTFNNCVTLSEVNTIAKQDAHAQALLIVNSLLMYLRETAMLEKKKKFGHPMCARWE